MQKGPRNPRRGRAALTNRAGRFEAFEITPFDDGWGPVSPEDAPRVPTVVTPEVTRSIFSTNDSPDVPFDRSINPYKGCEHGCIYCFARPTHAYLGLSPGLDFETRIVSKPDAPRVLRETLGRDGYRCEVVALGANTDPYQPSERRLAITRGILDVLAEFRHPVAIVTKSNLVLRDLDVLTEMARRSLVSVSFSITTLDRELARRMEPRAPTPERRVQAIAALAGAGVPSGVSVSPIIPFVNDRELETVLAVAADAGARFAFYILLRLPGEVKQLFTEWLETHYPAKAGRVLATLRRMHGGREYDSAFGRRMRGTGPFADLLRWRFERACRRYGLKERTVHLDTTAFRVPEPGARQLPLL
jgi:DNA repair photolyase